MKTQVELWKEIFKKSGFSEDDMKNWHKTFEKNHPYFHQSFLEWLGLNDNGIKKVRTESR